MCVDVLTVAMSSGVARLRTGVALRDLTRVVAFVFRRTTGADTRTRKGRSRIRELKGSAWNGDRIAGGAERSARSGTRNSTAERQR